MVELKCFNAKDELLNFETQEILGQEFIKTDIEIPETVDLNLMLHYEAKPVPDYELFAAILLDTNQLKNCMYYSAVKKVIDGEYQWVLYKNDKPYKIAES